MHRLLCHVCLLMYLLSVSAYLINMDVIHVNSFRLFCNKIWQAFRFMQKAVGPEFKVSTTFAVSKEDIPVTLVCCISVERCLCCTVS